MNIALDYDKTFTADKQLWKMFIETARALGHTITFVTSRFKDADMYGTPSWRTNKDIEADASYHKLDIVYCDHKPKKDVFQADIWIDDQPATIVTPTIFTNHVRDAA